MSPTPAASVVLRDVTRSFGPRVVLDAISLTISPRSRIGVIAPNGTGKTTLLRVIAGIDPPDSGAVVRMPPSASVGFLPQEPDRVAGETLHAFLARRTGVTAAAAGAFVHRWAVAHPGRESDFETPGPNASGWNDWALVVEGARRCAE